MTDIEKALRERLGGADFLPSTRVLAATSAQPENLVLAPFRLVAILDAERETIAALRRELAVALSHGASGDVALACRAAEVSELRHELATERERAEALAADNAIRDEALRAAHLARETATRERDAARKALRAMRALARGDHRSAADIMDYQRRTDCDETPPTYTEVSGIVQRAVEAALGDS